MHKQASHKKKARCFLLRQKQWENPFFTFQLEQFQEFRLLIHVKQRILEVDIDKNKYALG